MFNPELKAFKRGPDFLINLVLPAHLQGLFLGWTPTASIRRYRDPTPRGFIANLEFSWCDPITTTVFQLKSEDTADWPLGVAELDVLFTSPDGQHQQTRTVRLRLEPALTAPSV